MILAEQVGGGPSSLIYVLYNEWQQQRFSTGLQYSYYKTENRTIDISYYFKTWLWWHKNSDQTMTILKTDKKEIKPKYVMSQRSCKSFTWTCFDYIPLVLDLGWAIYLMCNRGCFSFIWVCQLLCLKVNFQVGKCMQYHSCTISKLAWTRSRSSWVHIRDTYILLKFCGCVQLFLLVYTHT